MTKSECPRRSTVQRTLFRPSGFGFHWSFVIWHSSFVALFQRQLGVFLGPRPEVVAHHDSRAGVPAQQRVVVARRADLLGLFKPQERLAEQFEGVEACAGSAVVQL